MYFLLKLPDKLHKTYKKAFRERRAFFMTCQYFYKAAEFELPSLI